MSPGRYYLRFFSDVIDVTLVNSQIGYKMFFPERMDLLQNHWLTTWKIALKMSLLLSCHVVHTSLLKNSSTYPWFSLYGANTGTVTWLGCKTELTISVKHVVCNCAWWLKKSRNCFCWVSYTSVNWKRSFYLIGWDLRLPQRLGYVAVLLLDFICSDESHNMELLINPKSKMFRREKNSVYIQRF